MEPFDLKKNYFQNLSPWIIIVSKSKTRLREQMCRQAEIIFNNKQTVTASNDLTVKKKSTYNN